MIRISNDAKLIKTIKKPKIQKDNKWYAAQYAEHGVIPFTLNIGLKSDGIKKDLKPPRGYNDIDLDNYDDFVSNDMNGMAIRTGCEISDGYFLILIDIDNKETEKVKNGVTKWNSLIERYTKGNNINTPMQKTGNNGLHYLFKIHRDIFDQLPSSGTELQIDGEKYAIDFKGKNQFMLVEPTVYDGKSYKWLIDLSTEIQEIPRWLVTIITKKCSIEKKIKVIKNKDCVDNNETRIIIKNETNDKKCTIIAIKNTEFVETIESEKSILLDELE
jgi:hypothetical protein